jgi:hypothetical protein
MGFKMNHQPLLSRLRDLQLRPSRTNISLIFNQLTVAKTDWLRLGRGELYSASGDLDANAPASDYLLAKLISVIF